MNAATPKKSPKPGKFPGGRTGHAHAHKWTKNKHTHSKVFSSFVGYEKKRIELT